jgi:hypothetical protein
MSGDLQVRQAPVTPCTLGGDTIPVVGQWGPWVTVPSPGFLVGYVLPNSGMVYEFRNEPEGDQ